jgi:hypothetical protein
MSQLMAGFAAMWFFPSPVFDLSSTRNWTVKAAGETREIPSNLDADRCRDNRFGLRADGKTKSFD